MNHKITRLKVKHEWPDVGTILKGRTRGKEVYAEIVSSKTKSGKAVKFNKQIYETMSGAAYAATSYSVDGWLFWKVIE